MTKPVPSELEGFYADRPEAERLFRGTGQLELVRTRELLDSVLPAAPAVVYDVGGGTGHHAAWLAGRGYEVHLIDPVPEHVARASREYGTLASVQVGDARSLPWPDASANAVLLMGPLYHLVERSDRLLALREARRVLAKHGVLFAVVVPRWASALVGMQHGWTYDGSYAAMVHRELSTGQHRRPGEWPRLLMDCFFHDSSDIEAELSATGFESIRCRAIEGPAWMSQDFDTSWQDPTRREQILELSRAAENVPELLAASPHVAVIARAAP
ncbi:hypothetical protein ASG87_15615 [Frateuria sp. Soil773]|uniref:class I SAM-dependent methyltransferase n=1 Tax=Frateuria sp. Soil773 TaxID=1736407 RepID=UPI0006F83301|nr:class I SAM-dependent methyltransferase [Frateuria sp. Soil773]KRE97675.1 hypothetical protein ASG87_15615 [Frateuria sp. Soil773]